MEKYYNAIKQGLAKTDQTSIFNSSGSDEELVKACKEFLKEKGYSVTESVTCSVPDIDSIDKLIGYFYGRLKNEHKEYESVYIHQIRDRAVAKQFINYRMQINGVNRRTALQECTQIVKTVLDHYDEFNFKFNVNFSIFGNAKLGWVTEKAIDIINKKSAVRREEEHQKRLDTVVQKAAENETFGYDDLDDLLMELDEENSNGSKEKDN